ncbi:unnamed protein product [Haemonchus placei]|uniref:DUF1758 domain-containing protein n=1 Tax=Haemonchus placei TaxID=6290 RepID=A0A0N4WVQ8_HAEPC|nr:unnamed protein product [Haemonchus placei]
MDYLTITLLLDSGAQRSFIKSSPGASLKLTLPSTTSFTTVGMGELRETFQSNEVRITLRSCHSSKKIHHLSIFTIDKLTTQTRTAELSKEDKSFIKEKKISIAQRSLIAADVSPDLLVVQELLHRILDHSSATIKLPSGLVLTPTISGYIISGTSSIPDSMKQVGDAQCSSLIVATLISSKDDYKTDIKHLKTTSVKNGTITTGFQFTDEVKILEDNFSVAYQKMQSPLRTLNDDEEKLELYIDTLTTYLQKGVIEEAKNFSHGVATFYLPHRHGEYYLNYVLFEAHLSTPLIHEVVLQFRTHLNTMVADIQKAFLPIRLPKEHCDVARF